MKNYLNRLFRSSIVRFLFVGGCSTLIDFAIYMLLSAKISLLISKGISMILASVFSYIANKLFTFKDHNDTNWGHIYRFYTIFGANLLVNTGVNYYLFKNTGNKILAFVIATICGMTVNYLGQRFWVFRGNECRGKKGI